MVLCQRCSLFRGNLVLRTSKYLQGVPHSHLSCYETNRILHRSLMQTEKFQPEGKRIMPETRFTEFPALSFDRRVSALYIDPSGPRLYYFSGMDRYSDFLTLICACLSKVSFPNISTDKRRKRNKI